MVPEKFIDVFKEGEGEGVFKMRYNDRFRSFSRVSSDSLGSLYPDIFFQVLAI